MPPGNPRASPTINVTVTDGAGGNTTQLGANDSFTFAESGMNVLACECCFVGAWECLFVGA